MRSTSARTSSAIADRVLARLLRDPQPDARLAVDAGEGAKVLGRVLDLGDVLQVDRHALACHHHQVADLVQVLELSLASHEIRHVPFVDLADGDVLVLAAEQVDDAIDGQVERANFFLRELDVDLPPQSAFDAHRRDAGHPLEARRQIVLRHFAERDAVEIAFDADAHDRLGIRVELEHDRRVRFFWQPAAHPIEPVPHVVCGLVEVGAPGEVERDAARAFLRRRFEPLETGDGAHRLLDRPRHELFHLERDQRRRSRRGR